MFKSVIHSVVTIIAKNGEEFIFPLDFCLCDLSGIERVIGKRVYEQDDVEGDYLVKSIEF